MNIVRRAYYSIKWMRQQLPYIIHADNINCYLDVPAQDHRVNIFDYHPDRYGYKLYNGKPYNLGDSLGKVIVEFLLNQKGIDIDAHIPHKKHLFTVGSNIIGGEEIQHYQNATIWGSGILNEPTGSVRLLQKLSRRRLDIRAVRGPKTKKALESMGFHCPDTFGDPAILMPMLYHPEVEKTRPFAVIPQFYHECKFREAHPDMHCISMNTDDYRSVISEILACKMVYTSSLHGIILAEAYGVPAVFFRGLHKSIDFKYMDYYASTGRLNIKVADTFEQALTMEPQALPDLSRLQQGLLATFPYDLWNT